MTTIFEAERKWREEADLECAKLIERGEPPWSARVHAEKLVSDRRKKKLKDDDFSLAG